MFCVHDIAIFSLHSFMFVHWEFYESKLGTIYLCMAQLSKILVKSIHDLELVELVKYSRLKKRFCFIKESHNSPPPLNVIPVTLFYHI